MINIYHKQVVREHRVPRRNPQGITGLPLPIITRIPPELWDMVKTPIKINSLIPYLDAYPRKKISSGIN